MAITVDDATIRKTVELAAATDTAVPLSIATEMVTEYLTGKGLSQTKLNLITLNLACHFCLMYQGGQLTGKEFGDGKETYASKADMGLSATHYGQMAQSLDTSGTLNSIAKPRVKAQFRLVGTADSLAQQETPAVGDDNDIES